MARTTGEEIERLVQIMARLRAEGGCPWDREQDIRSLRPYLVEETYEVLDEMDRVARGGSWMALCEELGDLLFQIVFHAQLAAELNEFTLADVCRAIADKIESRHPHVFGETKVGGTGEVLANWAKLKAEERKRKTGRRGSVLDGVPSAAPALLRAERLTEKASRIGFDWPDLEGVRGKLDEELAELDEAIAGGDRDAMELELGDVLFSLANLARFIKTPAEDALRQANRRFTSRFHEIEAGLEAEQVPFGEATLEQMERHWQRAKEKERAVPPPRDLPRAPPSELRLPVERLEEVVAFWDRLAPAIGWRSAGGSKDERHYTDGQLRLAFVRAKGPGPYAPGTARLSFEAPSRRAVDALYAELSSWSAAGPRPPATLAPPQARGPEYALDFSDPSGLVLAYVFQGP